MIDLEDRHPNYRAHIERERHSRRATDKQDSALRSCLPEIAADIDEFLSSPLMREADEVARFLDYVRERLVGPR